MADDDLSGHAFSPGSTNFKTETPFDGLAAISPVVSVELDIVLEIFQ